MNLKKKKKDFVIAM